MPRWPLEIIIRKDGTELIAAWDDESQSVVPAELLRVESPSAEVQGHGPNQKKLVPGKRNVRIVDAAPVGRYAVRLEFDDGHKTGIFTWNLIETLGLDADDALAAYAAKLEAAGLSR
jgi:DUF971 family protein